MQKLIDDFCDYLRLEGKSELTIRSYRMDLEQFRDFLSESSANVLPEDIDVLNIRAFLKELNGRGLTNHSISRKISSLSAWFKFLIRQNLRTDNPMRKIRRPKVQKKLPNFFSEEEMLTLLRVPDVSTPVGLRNRAIFELLYSSGLRLMELANIRLTDVDYRRALVRVWGKGNKERSVPIGSYALDMLKKYLKVRDKLAREHSSDRLFLTVRGNDFDSKQLNVILMRYIALIAREKGYSPHSIRHSFATHMLSRGADLNALKELLGHANLSTTEIYTHVSLEDIKAAYEKGHPRSGE